MDIGVESSPPSAIRVASTPSTVETTLASKRERERERENLKRKHLTIVSIGGNPYRTKGRCRHLINERTSKKRTESIKQERKPGKINDPIYGGGESYMESTSIKRNLERERERKTTVSTEAKQNTSNKKNI